MNISVIIPTRGVERIRFVRHALDMVLHQSRVPDQLHLISHEPTGGNDIVARVRQGIEASHGADLILIWEDDDHYAPTYIETMAANFDPKMPLIGIGHSWYYHIKARRYKLHTHPGRSSLFCTGINGLIANKILYRQTAQQFDIDLWRQFKGKVIDNDIATGIKHGVGLCGGMGHNPDYLDRSDPNGEWLMGRVGEDYYELYEDLAKID